MEVACYNYEGIDAVKNALRAGIAMSTEDMPIKVGQLHETLKVKRKLSTRRISCFCISVGLWFREVPGDSRN